MVLHLILDNLDAQTEKSFKMMCVDKGIDYKEMVKELIDKSTLDWLMNGNEIGEEDDGINVDRD